jgi:transcriptional regulator with XRE-family HTH domain
MARAGLGWNVRELAARSGVGANTISRYENGTDAYGETLRKLREALEEGGVTFLDDDGRGPGLRVRRQRHLNF